MTNIIISRELVGCFQLGPGPGALKYLSCVLQKFKMKDLLLQDLSS